MVFAPPDLFLSLDRLFLCLSGPLLSAPGCSDSDWFFWALTFSLATFSICRERLMVFIFCFTGVRWAPPVDQTWEMIRQLFCIIFPQIKILLILETEHFFKYDFYTFTKFKNLHRNMHKNWDKAFSRFLPLLASAPRDIWYNSARPPISSCCRTDNSSSSLCSGTACSNLFNKVSETLGRLATFCAKNEFVFDCFWLFLCLNLYIILARKC